MRAYWAHRSQRLSRQAFHAIAATCCSSIRSVTAVTLFVLVLKRRSSCVSVVTAAFICELSGTRRPVLKEAFASSGSDVDVELLLNAQPLIDTVPLSLVITFGAETSNFSEPPRRCSRRCGSHSTIAFGRISTVMMFSSTHSGVRSRQTNDAPQSKFHFWCTSSGGQSCYHRSAVKRTFLPPRRCHLDSQGGLFKLGRATTAMYAPDLKVIVVMSGLLEVVVSGKIFLFPKFALLM